MRFASLQLMWSSFVVLNAVLALLLWRARMGKTARLLAIALFTLNALTAGLLLARDLDVPVGVSTGFAVNVLTAVPLALLPWFAPFPRISRGAGLALGAGVGALAAFLFGAIVIGLEHAAPGFTAVFAIVFSVLPAAGCLLLADAYAISTSSSQRAFSALLLCVYVLKSASANVLPLQSMLAGGPFDLFATVSLALLGGALVAFGASVLRRSRDARTLALGGPELLVVAALAFGLALPSLRLDPTVEYLLVRPILLAYGIIGIAFAEVDVRERRGALGLGILAVGAGVFASIWNGPRQVDIPVEPARVALSFLAAIVVVAFFGWQLTSALHGAGGEPRRLLVYRAALEAARAEGRGRSAFEELASLRRRLGITPPEHDLLASDVDAGSLVEQLAPGARFLDRYDIVREAGRGSAGVVYQARDRVEDTDVAIKRLGLDRQRDVEAIERIQRETGLAASIAHENVVRTHRVELLRGEAYLVMEYVPGGSLADALRRARTLPEPEATRIARDVLRGLDAIHARGIVHRDVKPGNVLLDARGRAKLSDFSVSRQAVAGDTLGATAEGTTAGTLAYMAPEVARGVPGTTASDIWSVGATLYEMLAGEPPTVVRGLAELDARRRLAEPKPRLPLPGVSQKTNDALAIALAVAPSDRFPSARAMEEALNRS